MRGEVARLSCVSTVYAQADIANRSLERGCDQRNHAVQHDHKSRGVAERAESSGPEWTGQTTLHRTVRSWTRADTVRRLDQIIERGKGDVSTQVLVDTTCAPEWCAYIGWKEILEDTDAPA
jgi:hypothetical protein